MDWLPVMTLPDGTAIEMPMPSPEDTGRSRVHGYRVRGSTGVTEFATLPEVLDHLLNPRRERVEQLGSAAAATAFGVRHGVALRASAAPRDMEEALRRVEGEGHRRG